MTPVSYIISVTFPQPASSSQNHTEVLLAILNKAGRGQSFYGFGSDGCDYLELWIIPKGKKTRQDVLTELQAVPAIHTVDIVALSKPVKETELLELRMLFTKLGWDVNSVTNEELLLFLDDIVQLKFNHYLEVDDMRRSVTPAKMQIKSWKDHPDFSPDWLVEQEPIEEEMPDRDLTVDDIEVISITEVRSINLDFEDPPPTPPAAPDKGPDQ